MIRLIACDMDGTLLDDDKRLPRDLFPALGALRAQGVSFAVASGRQYASLRRDFLPVADRMLFISENGALVMRGDERLFIDPLPASALPDIIETARTMEHVFPVICRAGVAIIEESASEEFVEETKRYYPSVQVVHDLMDHTDADDVCKVAFYDEGDAQMHELPVLQRALEPELAVILSGAHWVDVMKPGVNKGRAMRALQERLSITPDECMAFGDYLNDIELLEAVTESYAMKNAHPDLARVARHRAPANSEDGVMRVLRERFSL